MFRERRRSASALTLLLVTFSQSAVQGSCGSGNIAKKQVVLAKSVKVLEFITESRRRIVRVAELLEVVVQAIEEVKPKQAIQEIIEFQLENNENMVKFNRECNGILKNFGPCLTLSHSIDIRQWVLDWMIKYENLNFFIQFLVQLVVYGLCNLYFLMWRCKKWSVNCDALIQVQALWHLIEDLAYVGFKEHDHMKSNCSVCHLAACSNSEQSEMTLFNKFKKTAAFAFVKSLLVRGEETTVVSSTEVLVTPKEGHTVFNDMKFYVPSNAVETSVLVSAALYRNRPGEVQESKRYEACDANTFIMSLVLELNPCGLHFKNSVEITLSHSASCRGWRLFLFRNKTHNKNRWEKIVEYCVNSGKLDVHDCDYLPATNTLFLTHFCRYCWVGVAQNYAKKNMYCSLFAKRLYLRDSWRLILILHDASDSVFENILARMQNTERVLYLDGPQVLRIGSSGTVEVDFESRTWESPQASKILQVNDLWRMPYATEYNFDYHIQIVLGCNTSEVAQEKEVTINIKYRNETVILTGWLPLSQTKDCVEGSHDVGSQSGGGDKNATIRQSSAAAAAF